MSEPDYGYGDGQPMGESLLVEGQFGICTPDDPNGTAPEHQPGHAPPTPYTGPSVGPAHEGSGGGEGGEHHGHHDDDPEEAEPEKEHPYPGEEDVPEPVVE